MGPFLALVVTLSASPSVPEVAMQQYRGDAAGALRRAEAAVAAAPLDPGGRLVATCAAIELGDLRRAESLLAPLEGLERPPPRAAVLRRLIERRRSSSSASLMLDLALAWRDAGRPDLAGEDPGVTGAPLAALGALPPSVSLTAAERLLIALPDGAEEQRALAIAAAADADRNALIANLQVLGLLAMQACPADPSAQRKAAARATKAAAGSAPGNGFVSVVGWLAGCPERLDAAGVTLLVEAAARPEFRYPRERAFRELLAICERADGPSARLRAISAWLALDVPLLRLVALAEAIEDPGARRAAGRALAAIGWRMLEGDAWYERLQGAALAEKGARLTEDEAEAARVRARVEPERAAYAECYGTSPSKGAWPFAAAWREWTPDEVGACRGLLRALSGQGREH